MPLNKIQKQMLEQIVQDKLNKVDEHTEQLADVGQDIDTTKQTMDLLNVTNSFDSANDDFATKLQDLASVAKQEKKRLVIKQGDYTLSKLVFIPKEVDVLIDTSANIVNKQYLVYAGKSEEKNNQVPLLPKTLKSSRIPNNNSQMDLLFHVSDTANMQGVCFDSNFFYVGFDTGTGNGKINQYDLNGKYLASTGDLVIGHSDSIAFRESNQMLYVGAGGYNPFLVREIDFSNKTITREINLASLGSSGLFTIDNDRDLFIVHTSGGDTAPHQFRVFDFDVNQLQYFQIPNIGVPQNIAYFQDKIYFYTNNKLTVLDLQGNILAQETFTKANESEGLCIAFDNQTPYLVLGYNAPNRFYALRNYENSKYHNLTSFTQVNARNAGTKRLSPKFLSLNLKTFATGDWRVSDWAYGFGNDSIIESITKTTTTLSVVLKSKFSAVEFVGGQVDWALSLDNVTAVPIVIDDLKTVQIQFFKAGVRQDPNTIAQYRTLKILVVGAVSVEE